MSDFPPSPLFRVEDQPSPVDLAEAERIARESGCGVMEVGVHSGASTLWVNPAIGSEAVVEFTCPTCDFYGIIPESRIKHPPGKPVPNCPRCSKPPDHFQRLNVRRFSSGPYELKI